MLRMWIASEVTDLIDPSEIDIQSVRLSADDLLKMYVAKANTYDFMVLPLFRGYIQLVTQVRRRGFQGPVVFIHRGFKRIPVSREMLQSGVLILNSQNLKGPDIAGIINFLSLKEHEKAKLYSEIVNQQQKDETDEFDFDIDLPEEEPLIDETEKAEEAEGTVDAASVQEYTDADSIASLLAILRESDRRIIISFKYFLKRQAEFVVVNLTAKLSAVLVNQSVVFDSIQPKVNLSALMSKGYPIIAAFEHNGHYYSWKSAIQSTDEFLVATEFPKSVVPQKRRYFRITPSRDDEIGVSLRGKETTTMPVELVDISERGFAFRHTQKFSNGEALVVGVSIDTAIVLCNGIVRHIKPVGNSKSRYGIETDPYGSDVDRIVKYILKKQIEIITEIRRD